ncbi:hypothetical protein CEQ90_20375 [Lewinellaceae bacterium SD302]|nr:hypothetical protein CEQ90_20375 [Lewinellaceae bacterium SD302]
MVEFKDGYLIALVCFKADDDRVNHMYFSSIKTFSIYNFDFGTNIMYFKVIDDIHKMKLILSEILDPKYKMCEDSLVILNINKVEVDEIDVKRNVNNENCITIDGSFITCKSIDALSLQNLKKIMNDFKEIKIQLT